MSDKKQNTPKTQKPEPSQMIYNKTPKPLTNYTLSSVCPACGTDTYKLACKVRCPKCGFMWDCSEL